MYRRWRDPLGGPSTAYRVFSGSWEIRQNGAVFGFGNADYDGGASTLPDGAGGVIVASTGA